jgi:hypothetical protein
MGGIRKRSAIAVVSGRSSAVRTDIMVRLGMVCCRLDPAEDDENFPERGVKTKDGYCVVARSSIHRAYSRSSQLLKVPYENRKRNIGCQDGTTATCERMQGGFGLVLTVTRYG